MTTDRSSVRLEHQSYKLKVDGSTPSDRTIPSAQDIRSLRNRLYLTREQFAELLGCSRSSIVNWELGRSRPREDYAERLNRVKMIIRQTDKSPLPQLTKEACRNE